MNGREIIELDDFERIVRWAIPKNITFPFCGVANFNDFVQEIRVSIFSNMGDINKNLKHTTIIKKHVGWVIHHLNRKSNCLKNKRVLSNQAQIERFDWIDNYKKVEAKDLLEQLNNYKGISERNKKILEGHLNGDKYVELSSRFGVTSERCKGICVETLSHLRRKYAK